MAVDYEEIGKQIRKYRLARGMTQRELAEAVDISTTHMNHIEKAGTKLSLPVFVDLVNALKVSPLSLLHDRESRGISRKESLIDEISEILSACSEDEAAIMLDVLKTMGDSFQTHRRPTGV